MEVFKEQESLNFCGICLNTVTFRRLENVIFENLLLSTVHTQKLQHVEDVNLHPFVFLACDIINGMWWVII